MEFAIVELHPTGFAAFGCEIVSESASARVAHSIQAFVHTG